MVDLDILATLVSVGTLATFFMISAGTLWRRYWDYDQPVRPALLALLAGIPVCSLGELTYAYFVPDAHRHADGCDLPHLVLS